MSDDDVLETVGDVRVILRQDYYAEPPDWDGQGYVFTITYRPHRWGVRLKHQDSGDPGEDFGLPAAIDRFGLDFDLIERWLRIFHDVVSFDYADFRGEIMLFVVTRAQAETWGCAPEDWPKLADQARANWKLFDFGDVWTYHVERRVSWVRADGEEGALGTWETLDSLGGLYGVEYAEQEARGALRAATS